MVTSSMSLLGVEVMKLVGLNPHDSAHFRWLKVDAILMPNPAEIAGFYRLYRLIKPFECATGWSDPTFTWSKS